MTIPPSPLILHALNHSHEREDSYIAPKTKVKGLTSSSTSNGFGMGHRTPTSDIPTCPPPDYNELFQSEAGAVPASRVDMVIVHKGDDSENEKNRIVV